MGGGYAVTRIHKIKLSTFRSVVVVVNVVAVDGTTLVEAQLPREEEDQPSLLLPGSRYFPLEPAV